MAGRTPACRRWQSVRAPEAQPAALFATPQGGTAELLGHADVFPLDLFLAALYLVQAQGALGASFVCSIELQSIVHGLFTRNSALQRRQHTVLVVLPERSVWPDRQ